MSGNHPRYYPWQVAATGIENPRQLRIIDLPAFENYATARNNGESFRSVVGRVHYETDYDWFVLQDEIARRGQNYRL